VHLAWGAAGAVFLAALGAAEQEPPGASARVEVVRVDVSVTDRRGRPVRDLAAADFEIREDGTPHPVTNFAFVAVGSTMPARALLSPPTREPLPPPPASAPVTTVPVPAQAYQRRALAFVVDDLNLSRTSVVRVRAMLKRFVERSLQPDDLVGLFRTGSVRSASVPLGADRAALLADVEALKWNGRSGRDRSIDPIQRGLTAPVTIGRDLDARRSFLLAVESLTALQSVTEALERLEGRKVVVFLSDGLKVGRSTNAFDRLNVTADAANRESLVVYTLDPRGVTPLNLEADDYDNDPGFQVNIPEYLEERAWSYALDHDGLERLAEATGGLFVHDTDPGKGLAQVLLDQSGYYQLGYLAPAAGGARFHRVSITVRRPDLRVRSRSGYWGARQDRAAVAPAAGTKRP
jgi:VWFA-related protein